MRPTAIVFAVGATVVAACATGAEPFADDHVRSVVGVEATGCSLVAALGSGTILDEHRVVTSAHTVAGADDIAVIDVGGRSRPATLVAFDPDKDLAVLSVPDLDHPPLALARARGGENGWVIAWDRDTGVHSSPMTVTKRLRVSIEDIYVNGVVERGAIEIDAAVGPGDSGGAVVNSSGEVVGVVYATSRTRTAGFALNDDEIAAVLADANDQPVDPGRCP